MASVYQERKNETGNDTGSASLASSLSGRVNNPQVNTAESAVTAQAKKNNYVENVNAAMNSDAFRFNAQANDSVVSAQDYLKNVIANKPGSYVSKYTGQLDKLYNELMNRGPFNYNMNGDALYDQYRQRYTQQGKQQMRDTMGQANAQTGGYGSSYAQTAGQSAYNSCLAQLQNAIPELQNQALNRYNDRTQHMQNQYNLAQGADQSAYGRSRDELNDWQNERQYATDAENNAYNRAYNEWSNNVNMGMTAAGNERAEAANDKASAQNLLSTMISAGVRPSAELIRNSGYSEADVLALLKKK